ncbi:PREDICTED: uncharacterized protein LOC108564038 [Nicrophorus vespilloides]|uniref:Uncharacterized protein LOC108564038 n=1 Tax=Nicrophorus vespilloides TaxID=110193 RepID=A0ABM1MV50_NICVS|nr:PREDICTED: uncharacterized protein LOC108564038 [Nicrophorus vespilloides]
MNLMFKKNFAEQKTARGKAIGSKGSSGRHTAKRSSREQGYTPIEEHHYRTHLFFSPPRCSYSTENVEGRARSANRIRTNPIRLKLGAAPLRNQSNSSSATIKPTM